MRITLAIPSKTLIPMEHLQERLRHSYPEYCASLTENEWGEIQERMERLARLLWDFSVDQAREKNSGRPNHR